MFREIFLAQYARWCCWICEMMWNVSKIWENGKVSFSWIAKCPGSFRSNEANRNWYLKSTRSRWNLPEVDGYKHLVVCIDYFSKWSEAKPLKDKLAESVSKFLYEIICRHGCMRIQINDQGKEFVNEAITDLHEMTGVDQRITSAYHPQSNGPCEHQNRNIKESLVKVLNAKPSECPYVIEGVLFAHRMSKHSSTKFSPFFLMYNRHPVLPVDIKYSLNGTDETSENDQPFNMEVFNAILSSTLSLREEAHQEASKNIAKAQEKKQKDYNRRHTVPTSNLRS